MRFLTLQAFGEVFLEDFLAPTRFETHLPLTKLANYHLHGS